MGRVAWTLKASRHLAAIQEYIGRDSRRYARRFVRQLVQATRRLETEPLSGRVVPEFASQQLREVIYRGYRIVYRFRGDGVEILAVIHGARQLGMVVGNPSSEET